MFSINYINQNNKYAIFNIGTGLGYSVLDLISTFEKVSGRKIPYEITQRRDGDVSISYISPKKANGILKWQARSSLSDMFSKLGLFSKQKAL